MIWPTIDPGIEQCEINRMSHAFDVVKGHVFQAVPTVLPRRSKRIGLVAAGDIAGDEGQRTLMGIAMPHGWRTVLLEGFLRLYRRERTHGDPSARIAPM